jgi:hypothetical protein
MRPKQVRLLAADRHPHAQHIGRYLQVTVPSILDHEVIAIEL